jgi:lipopolysaccharide biosynthesis glycosyltransferase/16S rRNA G966 N2-methylase RsmD
MSSSSFSSLQRCVYEAKQRLQSEKCVMLCVGKQEKKCREIYLNLFSATFSITTVVRAFQADETSVYTDSNLHIVILPKATKYEPINLVYMDKSTKSFKDQSYANCMQIKFDEEIQEFVLTVPSSDTEEEKKKSINDFIILPSSKLTKETLISQPVLLVDSEKGDTMPYEKNFFSLHFPPHPNHKKLQMSTVSQYSTAYCSDGQYTAELLRSLLPHSKDSSLLDACANVGGNTVWFARNFTNVTAVELDKDECIRLKNNCDIYGLQNVTIENRSCLDVIAESNYHDIIFYDPPWGGPNYNLLPKNMLVLGLDNKDTVSLIDEAISQKKASIYVLKHPENTRINSKFPHITIPYFRMVHKEPYNKPFYSLTIWGVKDLDEQRQFLSPLECKATSSIVQKKQNAFVWLVMKGDAYIPGCIASMHSVKKNNSCKQANLVVMCTSDVSEDGLQCLRALADYIVLVDVIEHPSKPLRTEKQRTLYEHWIEQSYTKWQALRLPFQKVCCLDCDIIAIENISSLFSLQTPAAPFNSAFAAPAGKIPNHYVKYADKKDVGADGYLKHGVEIKQETVKVGLMNKTTTLHGTSVVLSPSLTEFARFMIMLRAQTPFGFDTNSGFDEQSLAQFYLDRPWTNVHHRYNFLAWKTDRFLSSDDKPAIIHFSSQPKPWNMKLVGAQYNDIVLWYDVFIDAIREISLENPVLQSVLRNISDVQEANYETLRDIVNEQDHSYAKQWK